MKALPACLITVHFFNSLQKRNNHNIMHKLLLLILMQSFLHHAKAQEKPLHMITRAIHSNWTFKETGGTHSGPATVPGSIHTDLLANGMIEDPFYRTNEKDMQWIDKKDWEYSTVFNVSKAEFEKNNIVLNFEGLDTYADVYVNDHLMLQANNMFRTWEPDIKPVLKAGPNTLRILFHSPINKGLALLAASPYGYPAVNDQSENGELGDKKVSVFTRKAGYHYGWDWGPRLVTSGIWRPITLKAWDDIRIKNIFVKQPKVTAALAQLVCEVEVQVDKAFTGSINISNSVTKTVYTSLPVNFKKGIQKLLLPFTIKQPALWWSNGLGEPAMYHFKVDVLNKKAQRLAAQEMSTGLRTIKLIREKDAAGESFLFELNGVRVFMKGANYIPNDNFLPRVTHSDYDKVIDDAVNANMNMLRVWGGGVYEDDYFYKRCDEKGILLWQDFMFACSMYPGDTAFLENIKQEAIDNVNRLRQHPSIALWCGNNEINAAWHYYSEGGWGWRKLYTKTQQDEIEKTYLAIFHGILPTVVKNYTDGDDYWPSSPQAGLAPQQHAGYENTSGDMHYWGVWHGQHRFEDFEKYRTRFMSEYGFQSFPDFETVKKYTIPADYDIESRVMASHQRSGIGNLRIKEYMGWYYKTPTNFEDFLYMSQVLQAHALKIAAEAHRGNMPYCMGSLYWQINDCWPVASWSSTDYYHKWKAAHYTIKKAYEPLLVTAKAEGDDIIIKGISDLLTDAKGLLTLTLLDFNGELLFKKTAAVTLFKNTSTKIFTIRKADLLGKADTKRVVLKIEFSAEHQRSANNLFYFEAVKDLILEKPTINMELVHKDGKQMLQLRSDKLVKDLYLNFPGQAVTLADNYFDLLPHEVKWIELKPGDKPDMKNVEIKHIQQTK